MADRTGRSSALTVDVAGRRRIVVAAPPFELHVGPSCVGNPHARRSHRPLSSGISTLDPSHHRRIDDLGPAGAPAAL